ncbi:MAG TPA: hypothetical protein VJ777_19275 [Mycobacterium sp.]|nr:hypothetical protein [Mycobacterium sp.]
MNTPTPDRADLTGWRKRDALRRSSAARPHSTSRQARRVAASRGYAKRVAIREQVR